MGGYDKYNKTLKLLKILINFKKFIKLTILFNNNDLKNYEKVSNYLIKNKFEYKLANMKKILGKFFLIALLFFCQVGFQHMNQYLLEFHQLI